MSLDIDIGFFLILLQALRVVVLVHVIASWLVGPAGFPRNLTGAIAEPLCAPFRKLIPPERLNGIDVSPLFVFVGLSLVERGLVALAAGG